MSDSVSMKIFLSFMLVSIFPLTAFSQAKQEKVIYLSSKKIKERVVQKEFPDVPQSVRNCHAKGTFNFFVTVDVDGKVKSAKLINGLCDKANKYTGKAIANWKFKILEVENKATAFRGLIIIPFCYGNFESCD